MPHDFHFQQFFFHVLPLLNLIPFVVVVIVVIRDHFAWQLHTWNDFPLFFHFFLVRFIYCPFTYKYFTCVLARRRFCVLKLCTHHTLTSKNMYFTYRCMTWKRVVWCASVVNTHAIKGDEHRKFRIQHHNPERDETMYLHYIFCILNSLFWTLLCCRCVYVCVFFFCFFFFLVCCFRLLHCYLERMYVNGRQYDASVKIDCVHAIWVNWQAVWAYFRTRKIHIMFVCMFTVFRL